MVIIGYHAMPFLNGPTIYRKESTLVPRLGVNT